MPHFEDSLTQAMVRGLQDAGEAMFVIADRDVPVDKGTLKKSGTFRRLPDGFEIAYRTPYAAAVHFGVSAHTEQVRRHWVRAHRMRIRPQSTMAVRRRTVQVAGHFRGPFERHVSERGPRPWLQDAVDRIYPDIGQYIKRRIVLVFGGSA
jgi:hypothetical protein